MAKKTCPQCGNPIIFDTAGHEPGDVMMLECDNCHAKVMIVVKPKKATVPTPSPAEPQRPAAPSVPMEPQRPAAAPSVPMEPQRPVVAPPLPTQTEESQSLLQAIMSNKMAKLAILGSAFVVAVIMLCVIFGGKSSDTGLSSQYVDPDRGFPQDEYVSEQESSVENQTSQYVQNQDYYNNQPQSVDLPDYSWLSEREISEQDLYGLNADQLRILRNAIFAMHGYRFQDRQLLEYFSQFDWYTPSQTSVNLSRIEGKNVSTIRAYEKKVK